MSDLEQLLPGRLGTLADDLTPRVDPIGQAAAARSRHRRQRRARIGLAAVAVAVVAVSVGVPTAIDALSSAPAGHVAGPGPTAPTTPTGTPAQARAEARAEAEAMAHLAALSAARQSAAAAAAPAVPGRSTPDPAGQAVLDAEAARGAAELADTLVALDSPVRLGVPAAGAACPDAAARLSQGLGTRVAYEQGALTDGRSGCQWSTDGDAPMASEPEQRLTVGVGYGAGPVQRVIEGLQQMYAVSTPGRSLVVPVTTVDPQAVLVRFANAGTVEWSLYVPTTDGTGTWALSAFVGDGIASPAAGAALLQVAALATATWGG